MPNRELVCVLAFVTTVAFADDDAATDRDFGREDGSIEEIVILGERETTTLMDATRSIVVFTDDQLKLGAARTIVDLLQRVPNVTTDPISRAPIIRGVPRFGLGGAMPTSSSYLDGLYTPSTPSLWDTRQVEVQRGSANFVSASGMAGVDAATTNDPTEAPEGRVDVSWSPDPDDRSLGVAYGGPLTERLGYRIAAYGRSTDGFMSNPTVGADDWNSGDESLLRLKLAWQPFDEDTVIRFRVEHHKTSMDGSFGTVTSDHEHDPFKRYDFSDSTGREQDELFTGNVEFDHRFDDRWRLVTQLGLMEQHQRSQLDGDGTAVPDSTNGARADRDFAFIQTRAFYDDGAWSAFFRQYLYYLDLTNAYDETVFLSPPIVPQVRSTFSTPDWWFIGTQIGARRTFGRFAVTASVLRAGHVWHADRGVVWSRQNSTGDPAMDAQIDAFLGSVLTQSDTLDTNDFNYLPTVDFEYELANGVFMGVKYERAARLGGISFNPVRRIATPYDDEFSDGYEAFVRAAGFDSRLTVRANVFYTRLTDQQVFVGLSDAPFDAEIVNAQRSHNDGIEIESNWVDGGWNMWLSLGLLEAEFDRVEVGGIDYSGNEFPGAPPWTVSLGFTYTHPRGLFAETDATFRPETNGDAQNNPFISIEERSIVNARLGWAFRTFAVSLYARNLLDDEYLDFHIANPDPSRIQVFTPGTPREVGVTASVTL